MNKNITQPNPIIFIKTKEWVLKGKTKFSSIGIHLTDHCTVIAQSFFSIMTKVTGAAVLFWWSPSTLTMMQMSELSYSRQCSTQTIQSAALSSRSRIARRTNCSSLTGKHSSTPVLKTKKTSAVLPVAFSWSGLIQKSPLPSLLLRTPA